MPLALELAAVRLRGMPVEEILGPAERPVPRARARRGPPPTGTARCGHRLVEPRAVHPRRAAAVGGAFRVPRLLRPHRGRAGLRAGRRRGTLRRLAEKSVVQFAAGAAGDASRYQMLDTMREFGAELLGTEATRPGSGPGTATTSLSSPERAAAGSRPRQQAGWLRRLGAETASLRAALGFSFTEPGEAPAGLRMTRLLLPYWQMTGQFTEGRRWHELAAARSRPRRGSAGDHAWAAVRRRRARGAPGRLGARRPLLAEAAALPPGAATRTWPRTSPTPAASSRYARWQARTARAEPRGRARQLRADRVRRPGALVRKPTGRLVAVCLLTVEPDRAERLPRSASRRCAETRRAVGAGSALCRAAGHAGGRRQPRRRRGRARLPADQGRARGPAHHPRCASTC